jgi:hypothetical protein
MKLFSVLTSSLILAVQAMSTNLQTADAWLKAHNYNMYGDPEGEINVRGRKRRAQMTL